MKVPGLRSEAAKIKPNQWYKLEVTACAFRDIGAKGAKLEVEFEVIQGEFAGEKVIEPFFLSSKAISRLRCLLSRGGYPEELIDSDDVDESKVIGLKIWALIVEKEYNGEKSLTISGWDMKSESESPAEAQAKDYSVTEAQSSGTVFDLD